MEHQGGLTMGVPEKVWIKVTRGVSGPSFRPYAP